MSKTGTRAPNKMGSIRKRKDGTYEGRYTGSDGRQHSVYGKSPKAVGEALREALHAVDTGAWLEPNTMTVGEWLEEWVRDYCPHTTQRTRDYYKQIATLYIVPTLGKLRLSALQTMHVRRLVGDLQRRKGADALSATTVRMSVKVLSIALNAAVKAKIIRENAAADVPLPRPERPTMHIIDRPAFPAFQTAARATLYPEALTLLLQTGLRSGELRGLTWADWDEAASTLHVRHQLTPQGTLAPPKDHSTRDIVVGPEVAATIRAQRRRLAEMKLRAGDRWKEDSLSAALIFRSTTGAPLSAKSLATAVAQLADPLNLPGIHPHDLRHSYAVAALRAGADPKTVQHNLGHASAAMTLDIYAAYTTDAATEAARRLSAYWQDATK